jgi:hypothetical protein
MPGSISEAIEILVGMGWTREQAAGVVANLRVHSSPWNIAGWQRAHLQRLADWCSAHEHDRATIEGQLAFLDHDLHSNYHYIGSRVKAAKTASEAAAAISPYLAKVAEEQ